MGFSEESLAAAEQLKTAQKVELAHQLCRPHGPYSKSHVARALGMARGTLYLKGKQAVKDKKVALAIEEWYEQDDTRSPSQTGGSAQGGEKSGQAGDEEIWDRSSPQKETLCLSWQSEQYCSQCLA